MCRIMHHEQNAANRPPYFFHRDAEDGAPVLPDRTGEPLGQAACAQAWARTGTSGHKWNPLHTARQQLTSPE